MTKTEVVVLNSIYNFLVWIFSFESIWTLRYSFKNQAKWIWRECFCPVTNDLGVE